MIYYVDCKAQTGGTGSKEHPFLTISQAAASARPGDEVLVLPGVYREAVDPAYGGTEEKKIVYRSLEKKKAVITGAEEVKNWKLYKGTVWEARIPNELFQGYNPFAVPVCGDWFIPGTPAHTGEVYLNDKAMYETGSLEEVVSPKRYGASWDADFSVYTWFAGVLEEETVIYANFHEYDPNQENVEINVRRSCFYPSKEGLNYITLSGFTVTKAATQWAPPTAYQEGMIGPHWSRGWIIEDCEISNSKCSGISLGKYLQKNNDNKWTNWKYKDGTQTERDCICQAQIEGWTKERIGSHLIRRCEIHDCGQTGIVGHLGSVFSVIEDNHIHHINHRQNLSGAEIGGIKLHAAIDVTIRRNHFHHCTRGLWLDWQAQGTRVTQNLFHDNVLPVKDISFEEARNSLGEDLFVEVSHGPTLIDNNILLSDRALKLATQGVALVHNLIAGAICGVGKGVNNGAKTMISPRYTPYHVPHRTEIAGFMTILFGDMRFYNNIFIQKPVRPVIRQFYEELRDGEWDDMNYVVGTCPYNGFQTEEEWKREFEGWCGMGGQPSDRYYIPLPVWTGGNAFFGGAKPCDKEQSFVCDKEREVACELSEREDGWYLKFSAGEEDSLPSAGRITTETLGMAFEPEQFFENTDGSPIVFDRDYFGTLRKGASVCGPFTKLPSDEICVYRKDNR